MAEHDDVKGSKIRARIGSKRKRGGLRRGDAAGALVCILRDGLNQGLSKQGLNLGEAYLRLKQNECDALLEDPACGLCS